MAEKKFSCLSLLSKFFGKHRFSISITIDVFLMILSVVFGVSNEIAIAQLPPCYIKFEVNWFNVLSIYYGGGDFFEYHKLYELGPKVVEHISDKCNVTVNLALLLNSKVPAIPWLLTGIYSGILIGLALKIATCVKFNSLKKHKVLTFFDLVLFIATSILTAVSSGFLFHTVLYLQYDRIFDNLAISFGCTTKAGIACAVISTIVNLDYIIMLFRLLCKDEETDENNVLTQERNTEGEPNEAFESGNLDGKNKNTEEVFKDAHRNTGNIGSPKFKSTRVTDL